MFKSFILNWPVALAIGAAFGVWSSPLVEQTPLQVQTMKPRKLHGRFLQVSDMHPDPHYTPDSRESTACHRKKSKKKAPGYYGTPYAECDSPFALTNFTLDFLDEEWALEIDFVIWTGDNARHDNDRQIPRTPAEIYDLNRAVAAKMENIFTRRGIPVVPSLGNNDIWPHNILAPGPNSITNEYALIWDSFIPFPYLQVFHRGAYYSVEVIPDQVAVISLNTLYFYDSNKVVEGCPYQNADDPGNLEFDWLEVQLKMYRNRGMQVWITGHVPPSPGNYFPECYVRYVELALRFQDTILGHLYGHMNVDHFFFLEAIDLQIIPETDPEITYPETLYETLIQEFHALPKTQKSTDLDEYAVVNVSPAVVPNPYLPTFRIFTYRVSDEDNVELKKKRKHGHRRGDRGDKDKHCKSAEYRNSWKCHLKEPWHSDPDSPSRSNGQWTPLGYAQYYIPDLGKANETHPPHYELEYLTFDPADLHPRTKGNGVKEKFRYPVPLKHLPEELRGGGTFKSKYAPYKMADLTIPSWTKLARRVADPKEGKLRHRFRRYMYTGGTKEVL